MRTLIPLLLLCVALAGCSGGTDAGAADPDLPVDAEGNPVAVLHDVQLVGEPSLVEEVFTGSFQFPADWVSSLTGTPVIKEHDISGLIGDGHNFVTATVQGDVVIGFAPDDFAQLWTLEQDNPAAPTSIEAAAGPGGLAVQVFYTGTAPAELVQHVQAIDYTLTVTVERDPGRIPSGMALEVDLPGPGSSVVFTGEVPTVLVYGPDDAYLGVLDAGATVDTTLGENATGGKYIFMPQGHGSFYALQVGAVGQEDTYVPKVRIVNQELQTAVVETLDTSGSHDQTWEMTIDRHPLQLGICLAVTTFANEPSLTFAGPQGDVLAIAFGQSPTFVPSACSFTVMGDPDLQAGEHQVSYTDGGSDAATIQAFIIHYAR